VAPVVGLALVCASLPAYASPWAISTVTEPAGADEPEVDPEAVAAFEAGSKAYAMGNYEDAVKQFELAFELSKRSELLFNLGQAYSRWYELSGDIGHLKKARKLLQNFLSYLDENPDQDDGSARAQADERLTDVQGEIEEWEAIQAANEAEEKPVHKKAWFWVVLVGGAAVIAGAVTTGVVLSRRNQDQFEPELGTIGHGLSPGGLSFSF
jgi:tetratricopeptide (TPR) repeat protein